MSKKFQNAFSRQEQNSMKRKKDYMKYAQSLECTLQLLESQLHDSDDTSEVIRNVLKTACSYIREIGRASYRLILSWDCGHRMFGIMQQPATRQKHYYMSANLPSFLQDGWMPCTATMPSAFLLFGLVWCGNLMITHETLFLIPFYSFVQYVL